MNSGEMAKEEEGGEAIMGLFSVALGEQQKNNDHGCFVTWEGEAHSTDY